MSQQLLVDLAANLAVRERGSVDLRVNQAATKGVQGRRQIARVNALFRRPDDALCPDRPLHRNPFSPSRGRRSGGRIGRYMNPRVCHGHIATQEEDNTSIGLVLAKVNIGEVDDARLRQLRIFECIRDGSGLIIGAHVDVPCPCGDDCGDLLEPV